MEIGPLLAEQIDGTRDWTLKLLADFRDDDWSYRPAPGMAHAVWLCGHLACAQHLLVHVRCLGKSVLDQAFADHFPIGRPVASMDEHDYPDREHVLKTLGDVHARTLAAVRAMDAELLAQPAYGQNGAIHPHYTDKLGAVTHCMRHEAFHAGQLATIRRLLGKPFLR